LGKRIGAILEAFMAVTAAGSPIVNPNGPSKTFFEGLIDTGSGVFGGVIFSVPAAVQKGRAVVNDVLGNTEKAEALSKDGGVWWDGAKDGFDATFHKGPVEVFHSVVQGIEQVGNAVPLDSFSR
jgi:hypothetical protein